MNVAVWTILVGFAVLGLVTAGIGVWLWVRRRRFSARVQAANAAPVHPTRPAPARKALPPRGIELGGRRFIRVTEWTVAADIWIMRKLREAMLDKIERAPGQSADALIEELLSRLWLSGAALELLGGFLRPEEDADPTHWSGERAIETGAFLGKLSDPADRMVVRALFAEMLVYFFTTGLVSLKPSPNSSSAPGAGGGSGSSPGTKDAGSPTTVNGAGASSSFPGATPAAPASC